MQLTGEFPYFTKVFSEAEQGVFELFFCYIIFMKVKIVNKSRHGLPEYSTPLSSGMDLYANINDPVILKPLERQLVGTGIYIELSEGFEAQVRPRSGLAVKRGLTVLNTPGTIDADYRGEIKVIMVNLSNEPCEIVDGERIAQLIVSRHEKVEWIESVQLTDSDRGTGGFGHTGI
jgi:dUTP pyrophosphatase